MQSNLQQSFPLSKSKFWKKFIQANFGRVIVMVVLIVGGIVFGTQLPTSNSSSNPVTFIFFGIASIFAIIILLSAWYISAYIKSYYYSDDDGFVTIRKGVFTPTEIHVQYNKVQDVYVDQDLFDRILGLYDVHLATATALSGMEAHIDGVDATTANGLRDFLLNKIKNSGMSGAAPAMAMNSQVTTSEPAPQIPPQSPSVSQPLPSEISSTTFPLGSSWLFAQIIQTFVGVGFVGVIIFFWFTGSFGKSFPQGGVSSFGFDIIIGIIILLIIAIIMVFVQKSNYYFIFTSDFILYRTGLIALQERHVPYSKIQDVTISRGFIDMIFGLWNVTVENAAQVTFGRNAQNSRVIIMGLTKSQADFIANQTRSIMNAQNGQTTHL